ncbi:MAG: hypothetical protein JW725_01430 [Candidatus Babeliaceae bacterium]|nr:hypothetical protein [Candidatus Babeliaceae bacterium]
MLKKLICQLLLVLLIGNTLSAKHASFYKEVKQALLTPEAIKDTETAKNGTLLGKSQFNDTAGPKKLNLTVPTLSRFDQLSIFLDVSEEIKPDDEATTVRCITINELVKLGALRPAENTDTNSLLNVLNISSIPGMCAFADYASRVKNPETVLFRQKAIQVLASRPDLRARLKKVFDELLSDKNLGMFLLFCKPLSDMEKGAMEAFYYGKSLTSMNKNIPALRLLQGVYGFLIGSMLVPPFSTASILFNKAHGVVKKSFSDFKEKNPLVAAGGLVGNLLTLPFKVAKETIMTEVVRHLPCTYTYTQKPVGYSVDQEKLAQNGISIGDSLLELESNAKRNPNSLLRFKALQLGAALIVPAISDIAWASNIMQGKQVLSIKLEVLNHIYTKGHGVSQIVKGLKEIDTIMKDVFDVVPDLRKTTDALDSFFSNAASADTKKLINELSLGAFDAPWNNSIANKAALLWNDPHLLCSFMLMNEQEIKEELAKSLQEAGEIEVIFREAEAYASSKDNASAPVCLVTYADKEGAYANIINFYNPLALNALKRSHLKNVVLNSLTLGGNEKQHVVIVSGPNGSGKSSIYSSVILNSGLLDIAWAEKAEVSLFDRMRIYSDVKGNATRGASTFMGEKEQFDELVHETTQIPKNEHWVTFFDEAVKGTTDELGSKLLTSGIEEMGKQKQNITISIAHRFEPTELAQKDPKTFRNQHVVIKHNLNAPTAKRWTRFFTIQDGAATEWFDKSPEGIKRNEDYVQWLTQADETEPSRAQEHWQEI